VGLWANITYLNTSELGEVTEALSTMFAREGMERVPSPRQRQRLAVEPMQYESALSNDLWGLALFPGAPSWTIIQSAPLELLGERADRSQDSRLLGLCRELSCAAFQLNVYDGTGGVLVEVSQQGDALVSGLNIGGRGANPLEWNGETLSEERFDARFHLLPYQQVIANDQLAEEKAHSLARHFGGDNAEYCDNLVSVDTLISHKPLAAPGGTALYFEWRGPSRQPYQPAASWQEHRVKTRQ
jgi:hypothetical protein